MEIEIEYNSSSRWRIPWFRFRIKFRRNEWDIKAADLKFTEVEGLDFEDEMLEYRGGAESDYSKMTQPGLYKYPSITLKRGKFKNSEESREKFAEIIKKNIRNIKDDVSIHFLDEKELPVYKWDIPDVQIKYISVLQPDESEELHIKELQLLYHKEKVTEGNLETEQRKTSI